MKNRKQQIEEMDNVIEAMSNLADEVEILSERANRKERVVLRGFVEYLRLRAAARSEVLDTLEGNTGE